MNYNLEQCFQLFALAQEVQELPTGYAIRFFNEPGRFMAIAKFIEHERLCYPFFNFGLEVEPHSGPLWLRLTGSDGVKDILQSTLFDSIEDKSALKQLIKTGGDPHLDEVVQQTQLPLLKGAQGLRKNKTTLCNSQSCFDLRSQRDLKPRYIGKCSVEGRESAHSRFCHYKHLKVD